MHLQGFRVRVKIDGYAFAVKRFSITDEVPDIDVTNSEGYDDWNKDGSPVVRVFENASTTTDYARSTPGSPKATVELEQATLIESTNANPFLQRFSLRTRYFYEVEIFPNRSKSARHWLPQAMAVKVSHQGEVSALQPVTITLVSHGPYELYTTLVRL